MGQETKPRPTASNRRRTARPRDNAAAGTHASAPGAVDASDIKVGVVLGAWGVQGWLRILPFSASADGLLKVKRWQLRVPAVPHGRSIAHTPLSAPTQATSVRSAHRHGEHVLAQLDAVTDRDAAEALRGLEIWVARAALPPTASAEEFYWVDLLGCTVVNQEQQTLGVVEGLIETGPQAVLRIRDLVESPSPGHEVERMIPFVGSYVKDVNLAAQRITVDWQREWDEPGV